MLLTFNTKTQNSSLFQDFRTSQALFHLLHHPSPALREMEGTALNGQSQFLEGHEIICALANPLSFKSNFVTFLFPFRSPAATNRYKNRESSRTT